MIVRNGSGTRRWVGRCGVESYGRLSGSGRGRLFSRQRYGVHPNVVSRAGVAGISRSEIDNLELVSLECSRDSDLACIRTPSLELPSLAEAGSRTEALELYP